MSWHQVPDPYSVLQRVGGVGVAVLRAGSSRSVGPRVGSCGVDVGSVLQDNWRIASERHKKEHLIGVWPLLVLSFHCA